MALRYRFILLCRRQHIVQGITTSNGIRDSSRYPPLTDDAIVSLFSIIDSMINKNSLYYSIVY